MPSTDAEANATAGVRCACNFVPLEHVPKPLIVDDARGLVKLVVEAESHKTSASTSSYRSRRR